MSFLPHPTVMICSRPAPNPAPTRDCLICGLFYDWLPRLLVFFLFDSEYATPRATLQKGKKVFMSFRCLTCYWRGSRIPMHALVSTQEPISSFLQSFVSCHVAIF
jgi:hypothetical protein